ncbi:hypothetical protein B4113_1193 [Geobacillus sp. B4113_201601]|nr:hypothetical protein B4113_1193 [Geobacillus sp. B4113_201601]
MRVHFIVVPSSFRMNECPISIMVHLVDPSGLIGAMVCMF